LRQGAHVDDALADALEVGLPHREVEILQRLLARLFAHHDPAHGLAVATLRPEPGGVEGLAEHGVGDRVRPVVPAGADTAHRLGQLHRQSFPFCLSTVRFSPGMMLWSAAPVKPWPQPRWRAPDASGTWGRARSRTRWVVNA